MTTGCANCAMRGAGNDFHGAVCAEAAAISRLRQPECVRGLRHVRAKIKYLFASSSILPPPTAVCNTHRARVWRNPRSLISRRAGSALNRRPYFGDLRGKTAPWIIKRTLRPATKAAE